MSGSQVISGSLTVVTGSGIELQVTNTGVRIGNAITDTHNVTGSLNLSGSIATTGTITAQTLVVQTVSSSVIYSSGSNIFGNNIANTQTFTGSMNLTGSLAVVTNGTEFQVGATGVTLGNALTDIHNVTGSLRVTGSITSQEGFIVGNSHTIAPTGSIGYNNAIGVYIYGKSGSEADFRLYNRDGLTAMSVVAGTQNVHFNGNVGIGTSNIPAEANLSLGAKSTLEGGQLILQRGTSQVSASHLDNYQNQFRVMSGTDTSSNTVRMSVDMTNGSTTFYGSVTSPSLYGNSYAQTSASGDTSFVNTGIFYNTPLIGFSNNGTYLLAVTGNPNGAGSTEYRAVYIGYITVTTGYDFGISSVIQSISYTQIVTGNPPVIGNLTISVRFWNGTTETTQQTNGTTNNQIRIKIAGYNGSAIGAGQVVTLTKII